MTAPLRVERDGAVAVLTLDRPDVLNAFDEALTGALADALFEVSVDAQVRAVVITGAGRAFSAGQDLRDREAAIAAVNGVAAGAGLGVAAACDIRLASSSAIFVAAWSRVGLVPDAGSAYFLPRLIGFGRALQLMFTGEELEAEEALRIGLVSRVWPDEEFAASWRVFARDLAEGSTEAFALTKEGLAGSYERSFSAFLELEAELQDRAGRSRDYAEGVRAFLERRPPAFEGR